MIYTCTSFDQQMPTCDGDEAYFYQMIYVSSSCQIIGQSNKFKIVNHRCVAKEDDGPSVTIEELPLDGEAGKFTDVPTCTVTVVEECSTVENVGTK